MLEKIRAMAMEKLASEAEVDAFMEGFTKEAFNLLPPVMTQSAGAFAKGVGGAFSSQGVSEHAAKALLGLGAALLGVGIVKGVNAGNSAASSMFLRNKFNHAFDQVMATNKIVRGAKPEKAAEYAETLFRFAPNVASDPNLLSSILANAVLGEGVDPQTIKTLVELEGRYKDNRQPSPLTGIRV